MNENNKDDRYNEENHDCCCGHEHDCGCDEGCEGHEHIVTITIDDGSEVDCHVLGVFEVEKNQYIALLPVGDEEIVLFRYEEDGENANIESIDDDIEYEKASEIFNALFIDDEFNDDEE